MTVLCRSVPGFQNANKLPGRAVRCFAVPRRACCRSAKQSPCLALPCAFGCQTEDVAATCRALLGFSVIEAVAVSCRAVAGFQDAKQLPCHVVRTMCPTTQRCWCFGPPYWCKSSVRRSYRDAL
eukprot:2747665-Pyramimonas_sp.AAC.1